jgi:hypothetical protein
MPEIKGPYYFMKEVSFKIPLDFALYKILNKTKMLDNWMIVKLKAKIADIFYCRIENDI